MDIIARILVFKVPTLRYDIWRLWRRASIIAPVVGIPIRFPFMGKFSRMRLYLNAMFGFSRGGCGAEWYISEYFDIVIYTCAASILFFVGSCARTVGSI